VPSFTPQATASSLDLPLETLDPEVAAALGQELHRQQSTLEMIASENFAPPR
jgi:glycine hydroxymethyltransferase